MKPVVEATVKNFVGSVVDYDPAIPFKEMGVDSLSIVELTMMLEEKMDISLDDNVLSQETLTPEQLIEEVMKRL